MKFTIYQVHNGEKHYYIGDSTWTSDYKKAVIYDKIPQFNWMISHHYIETTKHEQAINIEISPNSRFEAVYNRKQYEVVSQTGEKIGNTIDIVDNIAYVIFKNSHIAERMRALQHNLQLFVAGPVEERKRVVVTLFTLGPKLENEQTPVLSDDKLNKAAKRTVQDYSCKPFPDKGGVVMSDKKVRFKVDILADNGKTSKILSEQESIDFVEKLTSTSDYVKIPKWKFDKIKEAIRLTKNSCKSQDNTAFDRVIERAEKYINETNSLK